MIVIADGNLETLDKLMKTIQKRYREFHGDKEVKFAFTDVPCPHYACNKPFTFEQLQEASEGITEVSYRAIGDERITLPGRKTKDVKHYFSEEELLKIGEDNAQMDQRITELEQEKKRVLKNYTDEIGDLVAKISHNHSLIRQKHEIQTQEVLVDLDFLEKQKLYIHPESREVLHSEPLKADDYQMKLFYNDGFFEEAQSEAPPQEDALEETTEEEYKGEG